MTRTRTAWALIQNCANAESVEAITYWEGINHALTVTNAKLLVECDCASLVAKLEKDENDRFQVTSFVSDVE
jgi:hypothetical protein